MTADPLADRYVVRNIAALMALDIAPGSAQARRISEALARRGLIYEQDLDRWFLTDAGHAALDAWDSRRAGEDARR